LFQNNHRVSLRMPKASNRGIALGNYFQQWRLGSDGGAN